MLGNYDSLPDTYTLADYATDTSGHNVSGVAWSDAGAADPIRAVPSAGAVVGAIVVCYRDRNGDEDHANDSDTSQHNTGNR